MYNKYGYKGMLRDRIPKMTNYALKWQKSKEQWINHVYQNFIKIYCDKEERKYATKIILGMAKNYRDFEFDKSIDWDNLLPEEKEYWNNVSSWVKWFGAEYANIKDAYKIFKYRYDNDFDIKVHIIREYLKFLNPKETDNEEIKDAKYELQDSFADFILKCLKGNV